MGHPLSTRLLRALRGPAALLLTAGLLAAGATTPTRAAQPSAPGPATSAADAASAEPSAEPPGLSVAPKTGADGRRTWVFRDSHGRETTLRGFNVSGSTKLYENGLLPFRSTADAARSAQAMRDLTGANAVRFLITWEGVQPAPDRIDTGYLDRAAAQIREFTDRGFHVLLDYHQDLYSSHLFHQGSWYTGDGAPKWVVDGGGYPRESCGVCVMWGQNMLTNKAVRQAAYDFWHNRTITTEAGEVAVQDAYLHQAKAAMTHLRRVLPPSSFRAIAGFDAFNEPYDGGLDGATGARWERDRLLPFYQRFRAAMDEAGWRDKPLFAEPLVFWNTGFLEQGGFTGTGPLGPRYVFNSHYYDGARMTVDPTPAGDGAYAAATGRIRDRAAELATAPFVSEFGHRMTGWGSDRGPWMTRAMYQGMDHGTRGAGWWKDPAASGDVLSGTHWHWDVYSGRHREAMNGNPDKILTEGDAWNDEDHSVVASADDGTVRLRLDRRALDRLYPTAVSGDTLAFAYEDMARSGYAREGGEVGGREEAWLRPPSQLPGVARLLEGGRQFGVLVWRGSPDAAGAPTALHLPASFRPADTVVAGDVASVRGLPDSGSGSGPVSVDREEGSATANRLLIEPTGGDGVHVALVVGSGAGEISEAELSAAARELTDWKEAAFG
ncbi:cellulase family glycosylhydrolase [Streptomyces atacamensis]|uniref:cellulase family glycosylhydrolase n=1 Tax=Streptomyces atacamensis TaxID=531966 RepID=UPI00399C7C47